MNVTLIARRIDALTERHGSLRAAARVLKVDAGYLSRLRDGLKTNPSDRLLKKLGIKRVVTIVFEDATKGDVA